MRRGVFAALAAVLSFSSAAHAADPDPREQFSLKQYAAAAAGFEKRWNASADPVDGMNGVVAWRVSAKYAHARSLLEHIRKSKGVSLGPDLSSRAELLGEKLEQLTATIELHGEDVTPDLVVKVDGVPVERAGDLLIADVGHTDISVEKEGCPPFLWKGDLFPAEKKRLMVAFTCPTSPGNLHVGLKVIPDATLAVDGSKVPLHYDVDMRLAPGAHHVTVERNGYSLLNEDLRIMPRQTEKRELAVPLLAQQTPFLIGVTTGAYPGSSGTTGVVGGTFGLEISRTLLFRLSLGGSESTVGVGSSALWVGFGLGVPFLHPLFSRAHGGSLWMVDFQPATVHLGITARGDFSKENELIFYGGVAPLRVAWSTADFLAELSLYPLGGSYHTYQPAFQAPTDTELGYAATALLSISYGFLGN